LILLFFFFLSAPKSLSDCASQAGPKGDLLITNMLKAPLPTGRQALGGWGAKERESVIMLTFLPQTHQVIYISETALHIFLL
jgi:hypothetical protein